MKISYISFVICLLLIGCNQENRLNMYDNNKKINFESIMIFKDTPAWDLAKAVDKENLSKIKRIIEKDSTLLDYQEPRYGMTVLMRAIATEKYNSTKALLQLGANPNSKAYSGLTVLSYAVSFSWYDRRANQNPRFVKLLLEYGADPNVPYPTRTVEAVGYTIQYWYSPLMDATGIEKAKLLVEYGADINYKTELHETAAIVALRMGSIFGRDEVAYYLIVEKKAKITDPYFFYSLTSDTIEWSKPLYPVDLLVENWYFDIGTEQHRRKMAIVDEFKRQGIDYAERKNNISEIMLRHIKINHPKDWKTFIEQY